MKTAVEWLKTIVKEMIESEENDLHAVLWRIEQAKEMEKQQIIGAWHNGKINEQDFFSDHTGTIVRANCAEKYYDETFKSE
jgi:cystathionine beta-lyase family protein involved in aluminum resistance